MASPAASTTRSGPAVALGGRADRGRPAGGNAERGRDREKSPLTHRENYITLLEPRGQGLGREPEPSPASPHPCAKLVLVYWEAGALCTHLTRVRRRFAARAACATGARCRKERGREKEREGGGGRVGGCSLPAARRRRGGGGRAAGGVSAPRGRSRRGRRAGGMRRARPGEFSRPPDRHWPGMHRVVSNQ